MWVHARAEAEQARGFPRAALGGGPQVEQKSARRILRAHGIERAINAVEYDR